jgi:hypothetical protein
MLEDLGLARRQVRDALGLRQGRDLVHCQQLLDGLVHLVDKGFLAVAADEADIVNPTRS